MSAPASFNLNLLHLIGPNVASLTEIAEIAKTIGDKGVRIT